MNLSSLVQITTKKKKRLGLGHGSGRVKTAGRGTKGQQARRNIPLEFEGGALPLIKRLPFLRGKGRNFSYHKDFEVINVGKLNVFPKNSIVDMKSLITRKLIAPKNTNRGGVKILGTGELSIPITIKLPVSKSAKLKIEKAGGTVEISRN